MRHRVILPQATSGDPETARRRLGGRARSRAGAGQLVRVPGDAGEALEGVVVFVDPGLWHVWLGGGRVLRTERVQPLASTASPELMRVAAAARNFAALEEGEEVAFRAREGRLVSGTVREKCRYGALVLHGDGRVLAVGFARLQRKFSRPRAPN